VQPEACKAETVGKRSFFTFFDISIVIFHGLSIGSVPIHVRSIVAELVVNATFEQATLRPKTDTGLQQVVSCASLTFSLLIFHAKSIGRTNINDTNVLCYVLLVGLL
jgi:hypothetical protein